MKPAHELARNAILDHAANSPGPVTTGQLVELCGLTYAQVAAIILGLVEDGLMHRVGNRGRTILYDVTGDGLAAALGETLDVEPLPTVPLASLLDAVHQGTLEVKAIHVENGTTEIEMTDGNGLKVRAAVL
jgi:predicted transcriptional regulator